MATSGQMTPEEIAQFLDSQRIVRVAFDANDERYLIPLGYVWLDEALYSVTDRGRKTEMAAINPKVSFQVDDSSTGGPFLWKSVTGQGVFEIVAGVLATARVMPALLARFPDTPVWAIKQSAELWAKGKLICVRIRPSVMTGRYSVEPGDGSEDRI